MTNIENLQDGYLEYYTEKLWAMIPEVYRHEDGMGMSPDVLRGLVSVWAKQAAHLRRSQDRLWADMFIETCSNWAIPYIGDLVGTRMISAYNPRGQRIDVAKTIYYRRRAGTVRVLEELIVDITGWEGVVVEGWKTLARTQHHLDSPPTERGRSTKTPTGGTADIRQPTSHLIGTPFQEFYHTADVRRDQLHHSRKIGFFLYRLSAVKLTGVQPKSHSAPEGTGYTLDPSGRDIPLFARRSRPELWDNWRSAVDYELPAPIDCRTLSDARFNIPPELPQYLVEELNITANAQQDIIQFVGRTYSSEARLRTALATRASSTELLSTLVYQAILARSILPDCGKSALLPASITITADDDVVPNEKLASANLVNWSANALNKQALIDPERGRMVIYDPQPDTVSVDYHIGVYMPLGAGGFSRRVTNSGSDIHSGGGALSPSSDGEVVLTDNATYSPVSSVGDISSLIIKSANQTRPYLLLTAAWNLDTVASAPPAPDATLTLDGLWIGASNTAKTIFLDGDYEMVTLRYCTLDPGGEDCDGNEIPPVRLVIRGFVEHLVIDHCITGSIRTTSGTVEQLTITDSVIQATRSGTSALDISTGTTDITNTTIMGDVDLLRLYASNTLVAGILNVTDTQDGCFRFSGANAGSRVPKPYEAVSINPADTSALFSSTAYGQPDYAMLQLTAPDTITRGGENGSEMGVYNSVGAPYKHDGLRTKIAEFMPFGLAPVFKIIT